MEAVELTEDQRQLVEYRVDKNLLIRGEPGSGKTTVLAARAAHMDSAMFSGSVLVIAYNRALAGYIRRLLGEFGGSAKIDVDTFHGWAMTFADCLGYGPARIVQRTERDAKLEEILRQMGPKWGQNHLLGEPTQFWSQEVEWIMGQGISSLDKYMNAVRTGRGTAVQVRGEDRQLVWDVFTAYRDWLAHDNACDIHDFGGMVRRAVLKADRKYPVDLAYDHILIDEVQDFDLSWLLALAPMARVSVTLAGDLGQRIYRRSFTWRAAGIDISAASSRQLRGSHRTTREIMQVAMVISTNTDLKGDEDFVAPSLPDRVGPRVSRIKRSGDRIAEKAAVSRVTELARRYRGDSICLAVPFNARLRRLTDELISAGVRAVNASGDALAHLAEGTVAVTTYHQLKGLEFDHVILTGLDDHTMPGFYFRIEDSESESEKEQFLRRLVYMAMTRARKSVTLVGSTPFCRFFNDVPPDYIEEI
ncbi:MAG TPA: AAA family ATPase [Bacillota bacterium]|nr:AAA family ATPase [Bacillota bacterium]